MFSILRIICLLAFLLAVTQSGFCSDSEAGEHRSIAHRGGQEMDSNLREKAIVNSGKKLSQEEILGRNKSPKQKQQNSTDALTLTMQGINFSSKGDYNEARKSLESALLVYEKTSTSERPRSYFITISELGKIYFLMGDYAKAINFQELILSNEEKTKKIPDFDIAHSLNNLAKTYYAMGDYAKSRELQERAVAILEMEESKDQSTLDGVSLSKLNTSFVKIDLAKTDFSMGDYAKSRQLQESALAILEKCYGESPNIVNALIGLAKTREALQDYAQALGLGQRALAICEKALGSEHPDTANSLRNLAITYSSLGDYAKARELCERALAINEKVLGPQHPETANSLKNLAGTFRYIGDLGSARSSASRAAAGIDRQLQSVLSMDEKSRLNWQKENLSMDVFASVLRPEQIAQLSIRWKGVVLDSLVEDRSLTMAFSKNENSSKALQELQGLRTQLAKIAFDQNKKEEADKISEKIGAIQRSMASRSTGFGRVRASADLTVDTILPALSGGSVFVDFIEFNDPKLKGDARLHYGAILIAEDGTPVFIRIPDRMAIDSAADAIRTAVKNGDEQSLQENLATLSKKLWQPVAEKIPAETKRIIVSPDGKLSFISFASLLDGEGKFICEKYLISYVASGRDLAKQDSAKENKTIALFANPKFDLNSTKKIGDRLAMRSSEISAFGNIQLPPLSGTEEECKALKQAAISTGWNPTTYLGAEATEQQIRSVKNTGILHLATHGFYLNAFTPAKDDARGMSVIDAEDSPKPQPQNGADPMRASGIALSGAQNTLKEWSKGKCPDPENDGILTAEEVAGLNLDGTWIVTLSACETGIGEARSGEGVFGLRRAFMMAGSKNLIMTLWPVNDASTAEIMADFYKRCFASSDASRSLAETQRDWLLKIKKDKGLLAAVRDAGPFVIATTGKP